MLRFWIAKDRRRRRDRKFCSVCLSLFGGRSRTAVSRSGLQGFLGAVGQGAD